jgi:PAS domain S-box-containing protein
MSARPRRARAPRPARRGVRTRRALPLSAAAQAALIDNLPVTLHRTLLRSGGMWFSDAVEALTGFAALRFAARDGTQFYVQRVHPDDRGAFVAAFADIRAGRAGAVDYRWLHADGRYRWFNSRSVLVRDARGLPHEVVGSTVDVTPRKLAEAELRDSELRHRLVSRATNDAIWDWCCTTGTTQWNEGVQSLFGYAADDVTPTYEWWAERIHAEDRGRVLGGIEAVVDGGGHAWREEYRFRCRDGSWAAVEDRGYVVRDERGTAARMIGAMTDVTMRRSAETALRHSEQRFRTMIEKASDLIAVLSLDGTVRYASPSHLRLLGHAPEALVGQDVMRFLHPDDVAMITTRFADLEAVRDTPATYRFRHADGSWRVLESHHTDLSADPDIGGLVVNSRDVTDRVRAEQELQRAKEAAEAASRVKSAFVANMSHEIRTPLNGILGMAGWALDTPLSAEQRECVETIRDSGEWLLTLVNDVLDFSKIEAGKVALDPAPFSVRGLAGDVVRLLQPRAQAKQLGLELAVDAALPDALHGDAGRVRQVLLNLVGNAVKFTERGGVAVQLRAAEVTDAAVALQVRVADTGIGIPLAQQAAIFAPFEQADASTTRRYGGTGLGLAIARQLVAMMDGRLTVESAEGRGSTFELQLRLARAAGLPRARAAAAPLARPARALRVLLAEDNAVNQRLALRLLEQAGHRVTVVATGAAACEAVARAPFDVVLMDVQMPEMDGFAATARIRAGEAAGAPRLPIIAMTAHAMTGDRERCLAAGMDGYVSKPIAVAQLYDAIVAVVGEAPPLD